MEPTTERPMNKTIEVDNEEIEQIFESLYESLLTTFLEVYTLLSLVCIAANVLIAFVIIKYKRLRQEKSNIILLHWIILNSVFLLCSPTTLRLAIVFRLIKLESTYCFVKQLEYTLLFANILLIILLTIYWYIKLYYPNKFAKLVQHFRLTLICIYIILLFFVGLHVDTCYNNRLYAISEITLFFAYLLYILFMIIINIIHAVKKRRLVEYSDKKNVPFILTNIFFLSYLPISISIVMGPIFFDLIGNLIFVMTTLLLAFLNPIYFFIVLYKCDRDYNIFFKHVFSCKCTKYESELVEQPVIYNNEGENTC